MDKEIELVSFKESCLEEGNDDNRGCIDRWLLLLNEECFSVDVFEEVVVMGIVGLDNCDSVYEVNVFLDLVRSLVEESGRRDIGRKEKWIGKIKRKSDEKEKDRERFIFFYFIS